MEPAGLRKRVTAHADQGVETPSPVPRESRRIRAGPLASGPGTGSGPRLQLGDLQDLIRYNRGRTDRAEGRRPRRPLRPCSPPTLSPLHRGSPFRPTGAASYAPPAGHTVPTPRHTLGHGAPTGELSPRRSPGQLLLAGAAHSGPGARDPRGTPASGSFCPSHPSPSRAGSNTDPITTHPTHRGSRTDIRSLLGTRPAPPTPCSFHAEDFSPNTNPVTSLYCTGL